MQMSMNFTHDQRYPTVLERLQAAWPVKEKQNADPLSQLVFMVISDNTPSALALAAFQRLRARFPRWSDLRDAAPDMVLATLGGVDRCLDKATTLPRLIQAIEDRHGLIELDFLAGWTTEAAREWLEALPGIDSMMSAATLNFSTLRRTVMTLDKDIARVLRRFGLVPVGAPLSALDRIVMENIPSEWKAPEMSALYQGMTKIAETVCHRGKPECKHCPLNDLCASANRSAATVLAFPSSRTRQQQSAAS